MKYLRSINESKEVKEVEDFIRDNLAYLFDDGFQIIVDDYDGNDEFQPNKVDIFIYKNEGNGTAKSTHFKTQNFNNRLTTFPFLWSEISDRFLSFLHFFKKEYVIKSLYLLDYEKNSWEGQDLNNIGISYPIYGVRIEIYNEVMADYLSRVFRKNNNYITKLYEDDDKSVWITTKNVNKWRHYYIYFKNGFLKDRNNPVKTLKLSYNTQSSAHYNFNILDNHFKSVEFNRLDVLLNKNGISFGDFNRAWFYIEEDYNNR